jgi:hypothetical protein
MSLLFAVVGKGMCIRLNDQRVGRKADNMPFSLAGCAGIEESGTRNVMEADGSRTVDKATVLLKNP